MAIDQHDVDAYYASNGEKYMPIIDCSCDFSTGRCDSWEEAGQIFDEHVRKVRGELNGRR